MACNDIAVVGLSFRLPQGVEDEEALWEVLQNQRNLMTAWPETRLNIESFFDADPTTENKLHSRGGYSLKGDPGVFDASFFSISAQEAAAMDPQQRWALETSYRALENAGIPMQEIKGSNTAVFSSSFSDDYARLSGKDPDNFPKSFITSTAPSVLANSLSWYFDLKGPSIHVDTACPSSLVALDLACQSLRSGASSAAIVVGTSFIFTPERSIQLDNLGFLSDDGRCFSFDHRANGYGRGEGVISMILKPIQRAVEAGDVIRAVIRATGTNQDGRTTGLTQPHVDSQEALIRSVYERAGLSFDTTCFFEAHGTGTRLGDSAEVEAIGRVFKQYRTSEEPLLVGSIKTNLGHLEGCSGIAGVLKSIMVLERGIIPPNALFEKIHPNIKPHVHRISVSTKSITWPSQGPRRVSINSFGFGGTNSHTVLDDAYHYILSKDIKALVKTIRIDIGRPLIEAGGGLSSATLVEGKPTFREINSTGFRVVKSLKKPNTNGTQSTSNERGETGTLKSHSLLVWSAADEKTLKDILEKYSTYFEPLRLEGVESIEKLPFTLAAKRTHLPWRSFSVVDNDFASSDKSFETATSPVYSSLMKIGFIFTGQGAQYVNMGIDLIKYPVFKATLQHADFAYRELGYKQSIFDALRDQQTINLPENSQILCTALQIALVDLLKSWRVTSTLVVGHSSGEIAAAHAAGALSFQSACKVSYHRGQAVQNLCSRPDYASGEMMSVNLSEEQAREYLKAVNIQTVQVACMNSPINSTLSGDQKSINDLQDRLETDGILARVIKAGVAYHSRAMQSAAADYLSAIGTLDPGNHNDQSPITMISSVTGRVVSRETLCQAQYWVDNLVLPVRFFDALQSMISLETGSKTERISSLGLVEIGPHCALRRPVQDTLSSLLGNRMFEYRAVLDRSKAALQTMLNLLGSLFCWGVPVQLMTVNELHNIDTPLPFFLSVPKYPFNHSASYWAESRFSRDFRLRESVTSSLLGTPVSDWNPLEPRWRKIWTVDSFPWIADHIISETVLLPGMCMLAMALEAVRHISRDRTSVTGYHVKEAHFTSAVVIHSPPEELTETMLQLRPIKKVDEKETVWFEVTIFALSKWQWSDCFRATIKMQKEERIKNSVSDGLEKRLARFQRIQSCFRSQYTNTKPISRERLYKFFSEHGYEYGDSFQLLENTLWDGKDSGASGIQAKERTNGLFHPPVLDASLQLLIALDSKAASYSTAINVPHQLFDGWVSASGWQQSQYSSAQCLATARHVPGGVGFEGNAQFIIDEGELLYEFKRVVMRPISKQPDVDQSIEEKMLYSIEWKAQLSLLSPQQLHHACHNGDSETDLGLICDKLEYVLSHALYRAYEWLSGESPSMVQNSLYDYASWISRYSAPHFFHQSSILEDVDIAARFQEIEMSYHPFTLFSVLGRNLRKILSGSMIASEFASQKGRIDDFYVGIYRSLSDHRFQSVIELLTHENPNLIIVELGAADTIWPDIVLSALHNLERRTGAHKFVEYVYTDISETSLETMRRRLKRYDSRVRFQFLDLDHPTSKQGFESSTFDLVLACSASHSRLSSKVQLSNIRSLLKPRGRLINVAMVSSDNMLARFASGLLPRLWSYDMTERGWDELFKDNGFSGNDLVIRDYESEACHLFSLMVSTAKTLPRPGMPVVILVDPQSEHQKALVDTLVIQLLEFSDHVTSIVPFEEIQSAALSGSEIVLCLVELGSIALAGLSEAQFDSLKFLVKGTRKCLWVSIATIGSDYCPSQYLIEGLFRSLRSEDTNRQYITLTIDLPTKELKVDTLAEHILAVFRASFDHQSPESEYIVRNGQVLTGRLLQERALSEKIQSFTSNQVVNETWLPGPPLKLEIGTPGLLDSIRFVEDSSFRVELAPEEVEIEAKIWGVAFRDIFVALGRMGGDDVGIDCAGIITRIGTGCGATSLKPGDRVCMLSGGCMRSFPRAPKEAVAKIPDSMSFEAAASIINPASTAYHCLLHIARLQEGERILIHSASGSTGQLAIWIAKSVGAEIFATVGFEDKKRFLIENFDIPEDHIFYSRNTEFAQGVLRMTQGRGVDVVLNSLSGDGLLASLECIGQFGRFIEIGKADIMARSSLPMASLAKNISFCVVDLYHLAETDTGLSGRLVQCVIDLMANKVIQHPTPLHIYSVSEVELAFRYLQSGRNIGRVLITIKPTDTVQKYIVKKSNWTFDKRATYLVSGGLGGIGRAILQWLACKGARYIIAPSRSGASSPDAREVIRYLRARGIHVERPQCDVSSLHLLDSVLKSLAKRMPPIKGCINATMVLQDSVFENMDYHQWKLTIKSKAETSWNLHRLLPRSLEFFIQLSSLSGIYGSIAQSSYSAACTFQDALARHRANQGERATSLNLGWMFEAGVISANNTYQQQRERLCDMRKISNDELFALLDIYCDPLPTRSESQLLVGVVTSLQQIAQGLSTPGPAQRRPLFAGFSTASAVIQDEETTNTGSKKDATSLFKEAREHDNRASIVIQALSYRLARALAIHHDTVDSSQPLSYYGVDSLTATELRSWFRSIFKAEVALSGILELGTTVSTIGDLVAKRSKL
ncbi:unnamed protein product [Clonostachys rhizophaga]|uniref:Carrier domain-containing protein n=1 Tax=Clonostachys rhizophaga TaxID=160324 RepID=A0A9N9YJJ6_9HYPO|nr:unnamed protein product [Clonostachys rhizophaga]